MAGMNRIGLAGLGVGWFVAEAFGGGVTQSNRVVLYEGDPANVGVLARTGDVVDGLGGVVYMGIDLESARVNDAGAVGFRVNMGANRLRPRARLLVRLRVSTR